MEHESPESPPRTPSPAASSRYLILPEPYERLRLALERALEEGHEKVGSMVEKQSKLLNDVSSSLLRLEEKLGESVYMAELRSPRPRAGCPWCAPPDSPPPRGTEGDASEQVGDVADDPLATDKCIPEGTEASSPASKGNRRWRVGSSQRPGANLSPSASPTSNKEPQRPSMTSMVASWDDEDVWPPTPQPPPQGVGALQRMGSTLFASLTSSSAQARPTSQTYTEHEAERRKRASMASMRDKLGSVSSHTLSTGQDPKNPVRRCLVNFVNSAAFDTLFAGIIIVNAVCLGLHVEISKSKHARGDMAVLSAVVEFSMQVSTFLCIVELMLRFSASGLSFFHNHDRAWNWLDLAIVCASVGELVLDRVKSVAVVRMIRFLRLVKILRVIRVMRFFRSLRILVTSIFSTLKSLFWAMVLLLIIMYLFAILFCQSVVEYLHDVEGLDPVFTGDVSDEHEVLFVAWGSVPRAVFTLFKTISNGVSWDIVVVPMHDVSDVCVALFIFYVVFATFAVLNVVTGVFCHGAIETAEHDDEELIEAHLSAREGAVFRLRNLFSSIDPNDSGIVTLFDLERYMKDDRVRAYFHSLDIPVHEAWSLFKLLDTDGLNSLSIGDFVEGCLRMSGNAKSLEIHEMMFQNKWMMDKLSKFMVEVEGIVQYLKTLSTLNLASHRSSQASFHRPSVSSSTRQRLSTSSCQDGPP